MKIQFHIHTRFSRDSLLPLFLLRLMCRIHNINCVCITDHNEIAGAIKFREKYENSFFHVIVGEEIFTDSGEIIGLYLNERIPAGLSVDETIRRIRSQGGIVIVPHPFEVERGKTVLTESAIAEFHSEIDAMESDNGRNFQIRYGTVQNSLCEKYGFTKILGSDAHTMWEIGANIMETTGEVSKNNFLSAVRDARFFPKHMPIAVHWITKIHKEIKLLTGQYKRR